MKPFLLTAAITWAILMLSQLPGIAEEPNNLNRQDDGESLFCLTMGNCNKEGL